MFPGGGNLVACRAFWKQQNKKRKVGRRVTALSPRRRPL